MKNQTNFIQSFINIVDITRQDTILCNHELMRQAVDIYLTYPCYLASEGWSAFDDSAKRGSGAFGICKQDEFLTADLMTSVKAPVNAILEIVGQPQFAYGVRGESIIRMLRDGRKVHPELDTYLQAFARVYDWTGNMMPVRTNALWGRVDDNWKAKLSFIRKCFSGEDTGQEKYSWQYKWREWLLGQWIDKDKKDFRDFVSENYWQDAVEDGTCGKIKDLWEKNPHGYIAKDFNLEEIKMWLIANTKLIIQRSYRICYGFAGDFNESKADLQRLQSVFETILGKNTDLNPF